MQAIWAGRAEEGFMNTSDQHSAISRQRSEAGGLFYGTHEPNDQNLFFGLCDLAETSLFQQRL